MKYGLGFNSHSYFFSDLPIETDIQIIKKLIIELLDLTLTQLAPLKFRYQAVLQFGDESWPFLKNSELLHFLNHESKLREITPIIHQLDRIHPLTHNFSGWVQRYLSISQDVGSPYLIIHLPPNRNNTLRETAKALTANQILDSLYRGEVTIALENVNYKKPTPFFGELENTAALFRRIEDRLKNTPYEGLEEKFKVCFDYGHFTVNARQSNENIGEKMEWFISAAGEKIDVLHVHMNDGTEDQHLLLGEYPLNANLQVLKEHERNLLSALKKLREKTRIFIVEKNSPFQTKDMIRCFEVLDEAIRNSCSTLTFSV